MYRDTARENVVEHTGLEQIHQLESAQKIDFGEEDFSHPSAGNTTFTFRPRVRRSITEFDPHLFSNNNTGHL